MVPCHARRPSCSCRTEREGRRKRELRSSCGLRCGSDARMRRRAPSARRAPRSTAPAHPPRLQLGGVETDVAAQPHVRDPVRARLSEHPGCRHVEQRCGALRVEKRCHVTGNRGGRQTPLADGTITRQLSRFRDDPVTSNTHALIVDAVYVASGGHDERLHASLLMASNRHRDGGQLEPLNPASPIGGDPAEMVFCDVGGLAPCVPVMRSSVERLTLSASAAWTWRTADRGPPADLTLAPDACGVARRTDSHRRRGGSPPMRDGGGSADS
jgi:hypothetical protein